LKREAFKHFPANNECTKKTASMFCYIKFSRYCYHIPFDEKKKSMLS
jgi:hypothetical protein